MRAMCRRPSVPGSSPPSPGFAPCEILICNSSALVRYSIVTPKRPDATCLMADRLESPFGIGLKRSGSSPPSPVLLLPPMRFMAIASVSCASAEMRAETHRTGAETLDDFSWPARLPRVGIGPPLAPSRNRSKPRNVQRYVVHRRLAWSANCGRLLSLVRAATCESGQSLADPTCAARLRPANGTRRDSAALAADRHLASG